LARRFTRSESFWFFLWGSWKGKIFNSNPLTEEVLKEYICMQIVRIPAQELQMIIQNPFRRWEECPLVEGRQFQHNMWSVNCDYFITNVTGQQDN
jgi:hypothetical protein